MTRINVLSLKQVKESGGNYNLPNKISSPADARNVVQTVLDLNSSSVEKFGIINLDSKNKINGIHIVSIGSLNAAIVHPRDVFKQALLNNAASIIAFHNHPSGDPTPSPEDIVLTRRLVECGELMGVTLLDHIIVGDGTCFYSLKSQGDI